MANRTGPALVPHDQGDKPIHNLGRGSVGSDAARRDDILAPADIVPDRNGGSGYSGVNLPNGQYPASIRHSHPMDDPAIVGSTFYPAVIKNPLAKPSARAVLANGATIFGFSTGAFVPVPGAPYTWQVDGAPGPMFGEPASGYDPIQFQDGDYFMIAIDESEGTGPENPYFGLYRWIDCGYHLVGGIPVLSRASFVRVDEMNEAAEFQTGAYIRIVGTGARYNGQSFVLTNTGVITLDTTPLTFSIQTIPEATPSYKLLTGPQLTTQGASNDTQTVSTAVTSGAVILDPVTPTLLGTPGLSEIPAGPYKVTARLRVSADSGAYVTQFFYRLRIRHADNSLGVNLLDIISPPLNNTSDLDYTFTAFGTPFTISPTDRIEAVPCFQTTSPTPITCYLTYQEPTRATRIVVPFVATAGSTTVPAGAITPGRIHTPFGEATIVDTRLTIPDRNDCLVTADASGLLTAIATDGWVGGDKIWLTVLDPINVIHNATSYPVNFAPLFLSSVAGVPGDIKTKPVSPTTGDLFNNRFQFQLRTDAGIAPSPCWQLIAPHVAGKKA